MKKLDFIYRLFVSIFIILVIFTIGIIPVSALNEQDYKFDVIFDNGKTQMMQGTSFNKQFQNVIRITVFNNSVKIYKGETYKLYMTYTYESNHGYVALDTNRLYVGNYSWTDWTLTTPTWMNLDKQQDLGNGYYLLEYGVVLEFTATFNSTGLSQDFYFNDFPTLRGFVINRFDIECSTCSTGGGGGGGSNTDFTDLINNQNKNTQDIINNQNQNNNALLDKQQENINAIKDLTEQEKENNEKLLDDDKENNIDKAGSFFKDYSYNDHGLTGVVTAPLELIKSLTTASCSPLTFELPIVHNVVTLPCMSSIYKQYFGVFFTLWQMITTGMISYTVLLNMYSQVRKLQNPNNDKIEVINL